MLDLAAGMFDVDEVANDALYESLTVSSPDRTCGVGALLCLIHDPPLCVPAAFHTYLVALGDIIPGSTAARAGLAPGDLVAAVDGIRLEYGQRVYLPEEVAAMIQGPAGTTVELRVQRAGRDRTVRLVREPVGGAVPGGVKRKGRLTTLDERRRCGAVPG